ncbi:MAG: penicillin acylase family protein [Rhodoferax sp.]|nr:penicillin acylase family protein [Rhodoferax sp.]
MFEPDQSAEALIKLMQSKTAKRSLGPWQTSALHASLNLVIADRDNIGWQVTGRYPIRAKGALACCHHLAGRAGVRLARLSGSRSAPLQLQPAQGTLAPPTATLPAEESHKFSTSWYAPERSECVHQPLAANSAHTTESSIAMAASTSTPCWPTNYAYALTYGPPTAAR